MERSIYGAFFLGEIDGIFWGFRDKDISFEMQMEASVRNDLRKYGFSEEEVQRSVRRESLGAMAGCKSYAILQITGRAAHAWAEVSGDKLFDYVERIHVKTWLSEKEEGETELFFDMAERFVRSVQVVKTNSGRNAKSTKIKGRTSLQLGSKRAERQLFIYQRKGERLGFEFKIKGEPVKELKIDCEFAKSITDALPASERGGFVSQYHRLFVRVCQEAESFINRNLEREGLRIEDYYVGIHKRNGEQVATLAPAQTNHKQAPVIEKEVRKRRSDAGSGLIQSVIDLWGLDELEPEAPPQD